jgi:hypothetical protein
MRAHHGRTAVPYGPCIGRDKRESTLADEVGKAPRAVGKQAYGFLLPPTYVPKCESKVSRRVARFCEEQVGLDVGGEAIVLLLRDSLVQNQPEAIESH